VTLAAELDSAWAAKPLALTRYEWRTILILTDPGGEPWIWSLSGTTGNRSVCRKLHVVACRVLRTVIFPIREIHPTRADLVRGRLAPMGAGCVKMG
jgi:hypothetical protein